jgi:hypothetical protein
MKTLAKLELQIINRIKQRGRCSAKEVRTLQEIKQRFREPARKSGAEEALNDTLIVEHEIGEETHRLRLGELHHDQSGLGIDVKPQLAPTRLLELPGLKKKTSEQSPKKALSSRGSSRGDLIN